MVTPADRQDSDITRDQLGRIELTHPELTLPRADSAHGRAGRGGGEMELVGIAVHGGRNGVDKALKGLTLHP
ncbi:hypothetical protein AB0C27_39620 [Nonomuraea sp. NPDC048882]|uniref:hypothetical protein n=1 Tax=Nonomuraea sp. NPDC048882 TaxID=3154347 RepID=UPI0033CA9147